MEKFKKTSFLALIILTNGFLNSCDLSQIRADEKCIDSLLVEDDFCSGLISCWDYRHVVYCQLPKCKDFPNQNQYDFYCR